MYISFYVLESLLSLRKSQLLKQLGEGDNDSQENHASVVHTQASGNGQGSSLDDEYAAFQVHFLFIVFLSWTKVLVLSKQSCQLPVFDLPMCEITGSYFQCKQNSKNI